MHRCEPGRPKGPDLPVKYAPCHAGKLDHVEMAHSDTIL